MKKLLFSGVLCLLFNIVHAQLPKEKIATIFLTHSLKNDSIDLAYNLCSEELKGDLDFDAFKSAIKSVQNQVGMIQEFQMSCEDGNEVYVRAKHSLLPLNWRVVFETNGNKIIGFFVAPSIPCESDLNTFEGGIENELILKTETSEVKGKVLIPKNKSTFPLVLMLQGSGPHSLDYEIGPNKYFKSLAQELCKNGIGSLRLDKRTIANSLDVQTLYYEQIEDAIIGIQTCRKMLDDSISSIFVLGHSLGVASLVPVEENSDVDGLIALSGSPRSLLEIMNDQVDYLRSIDSTNYDSILDRKIDYALNSLCPESPVDSLPLSIPAEYWIYLNDLHLTKKFKKVRTRSLVITASHDYHLNENDYSIWRNISKKNKSISYYHLNGLNHLLAESKSMSKPSDYGNIQVIDESVVNLIISFIKDEDK